MQSIISFLLKASKISFLFLVAFAFFHILVGTFNPGLFSDYFQIEVWKETLFSFRYRQFLRNILQWIPIIWWVISGIYCFKLILTDWYKRTLKWLLLYLLLCVFWPFIGYFMIKFDWWFTDLQKALIKQFMFFWCYGLWVNLSRWIGAVMVDMVTMYRAIVDSIADSV